MLEFCKHNLPMNEWCYDCAEEEEIPPIIVCKYGTPIHLPCIHCMKENEEKCQSSSPAASS
jgi:hypothetical protein